MKILDFYILKRLAGTFIFVIVLATCLLIVFDYVDNADTFVKNEASLRAIFADYYLNLIPYFISTLSPIIIFITIIYVTSKMASHQEITAMFTGGVSFSRFLVPYVVFSSGLSIFIFILVGWVIPKASTVRIAFENRYLKSAIPYSEKDVHIKVAPHNYVYVKSYNSHTNVGNNFTLEFIEGNSLKSKLSADSIIWKSSTQSWQLCNYNLRTIKGKNEIFQYGIEKNLKIDLSPDDFSYKFWLHKELSLGEIDDYIDYSKKRGNENIRRFHIEKYQRYSFPFTILLLAYIAVIFSYNKTRGGSGGKIAIEFLLIFLYLILTLASQSFAEYGNIDPLLAVFFPNILFALLAVVIYKVILNSFL